MAEQGRGFVPGRHKIDAYGDGGFRFAEMSHRGSLLALPSGVHAIDAFDAAAVDEAMVAPLLAEPPEAVELLISAPAPICARSAPRSKPACARAESWSSRWRLARPCAPIIC
ncbi:hypothetical protein Ms3S1_06020 [Methylosinus sp. 3S-1]